MKKSILYSIICGSCLVASTGLTLIASGIEQTTNNNDTNNNNTNNVIMATNDTLNDAPKSFSQNETVYVITDHTGAKTKSFVNNTINTSEEPIPIEMHITYSLDGAEISSNDLAGKSGHVKITYDFSAIKSLNGKKVPFLTVTGLLLNSNKFKNVKVENGKIISESEDNTIIAGYTLVGVNEDLNLDILPTSFSFEADATDFAIDTTYTFATNELFADLDTSKLNSIDDIITQMNQLSSGLDQIISGSNSLTTGLDSATNGAKALQAGLKTLTDGTSTLASGTKDLATGAHALEDGAYQLSNGLNQIVAIDNEIVGKIDETTAEVVTKYNEFITEYARVIDLLSRLAPHLAERLTLIKQQITDFYDNAYSKVIAYTGGIEALADGANKLAGGLTELSTGADSLMNGASALASGATELSLGMDSLVDGLGALTTGGHTLYNGLITFKEQGIDKLANFANNDLKNLTDNIRSSVSTAKSYHYYSDPSAKSVKFIFKTPSLK